MSQATISFNQIITDPLYALAKFGALIWQIITWPYFLHVTITLILALFCLWLAKEYRKWNQGWLSFLIEKQISESTNKKEQGHNKKGLNFTLKRGGVTKTIGLVKLGLLEILEKIITYFKRKVAYDIKHPNLPSLTSLLALLVTFALFFILAHSDVPYNNSLSSRNWLIFVSKNVEVNERSNIVSILVGFVAIVLALVILIAESIRESKDPEQKKVLLSISGLWFLFTLTTLSLLNFLWFKVTVFSLIFPLLIAGGIIYSFWRVIHTLIDPEVREKNRIKLLKERFERIVFDSVRERIGNSILLGKVGQDKEIKLAYTFSKRWLDRSAGDYSFIESNKEGWLILIWLNLIDSLNA